MLFSFFTWDELILLVLVYFNNKGKGNDAVSSVLVVCKLSLIFLVTVFSTIFRVKFVTFQ